MEPVRLWLREQGVYERFLWEESVRKNLQGPISLHYMHVRTQFASAIHLRKHRTTFVIKRFFVIKFQSCLILPILTHRPQRDSL